MQIDKNHSLWREVVERLEKEIEDTRRALETKNSPDTEYNRGKLAAYRRVLGFADQN